MDSRGRLMRNAGMVRAPSNIAGNDDSIFEELLDAEVAVDMAKLREASRLGIPSAYRGTVYRYLLGVAFMDKSSEMTMERIQEKDFKALQIAAANMWSDRAASEGKKGESDIAAEVRRRLLPKMVTTASLVTREATRAAHGAWYSTRSTVDSQAAWDGALIRLRHCTPYCVDTARWRCAEEVLGALRIMYSDASQEEVQVLVALTLPFESLCAQPREAFFCVHNLYQILTHFDNILQDDRCMEEHCGTFLMMFRIMNKALYRHFCMEGVTTLEWVPDLLSTLLAGRLHPDDLYRLWDFYLADAWEQVGFPLHAYVCLALLSQMTEDLIECEKTELLHRLKHLPRIDPTDILQQAVSLRESVYSKGLLA